MFRNDYPGPGTGMSSCAKIDMTRQVLSWATPLITRITEIWDAQIQFAGFFQLLQLSIYLSYRWYLMRWAVGKLWSKLFFVDTWLFKDFFFFGKNYDHCGQFTHWILNFRFRKRVASHAVLLISAYWCDHTAQYRKLFHTQTRRYGNFSSFKRRLIDRVHQPI